MTASDQKQYPPQAVVLRNGATVTIRPLAETDGAGADRVLRRACRLKTSVFVTARIH